MTDLKPKRQIVHGALESLARAEEEKAMLEYFGTSIPEGQPQSAAGKPHLILVDRSAFFGGAPVSPQETESAFCLA